MLKRNDTPVFDLLSYFEGTTTAHGVFEDRKGRLKRRFTAEMTGRTESGRLILDERFLFDDGERQQRVWTLARTSPGQFTGSCQDAVAPAHGTMSDGVATLASRLRLKVSMRHITMDFDDVFYEIGSGLVLNRSTVSKWGIRVGQVLITFRKS
jgi:hypothetical protein